VSFVERGAEELRNWAYLDDDGEEGYDDDNDDDDNADERWEDHGVGGGGSSYGYGVPAGFAGCTQASSLQLSPASLQLSSASLRLSPALFCFSPGANSWCARLDSTTAPSKPHHQAGKECRKPASKVTTKHDPTLSALANAKRMEKVASSSSPSSFLFLWMHRNLTRMLDGMGSTSSRAM